jgi:hypothetical protein
MGGIQGVFTKPLPRANSTAEGKSIAASPSIGGQTALAPRTTKTAQQNTAAP